MTLLGLDNVLKFVGIQRQLMRAFIGLYPASKDFRWLTDFPKSGVVRISEEQWDFVKHGAGLRFTRSNYEPHTVVDMHRCIDEPSIVDLWRLEQFFASQGMHSSENEILEMLTELCANQHLLDQGGGQYLLRS